MKRTALLLPALIASATFGATAFAPAAHAGIPGPPNDSIGNATSIDGASGSLGGTTVQATRSGQDPSDLPGDGGTVWYRWQATQTGPQSFLARTDGAGDSTIGVYTDGGETLTTVVVNDDDRSTDGRARFNAVAGTTYLIGVGAYDEMNASAFQLVWTTTLVPSEMSISGNFFADPGSRPVLRVKVVTGFQGDRSRGTGRVTLVDRGEVSTKRLVRGIAKFRLATLGRRSFTVRASWPGEIDTQPASARAEIFPGSGGEGRTP